MWFEGRGLVNITYVDPENGFRLRTDEEMASFVEKQTNNKADSRQSEGDIGELRGLRGIELSKGISLEDLGRTKDLIVANN